jgi:cell division inhibitor SulA
LKKKDCKWQTLVIPTQIGQKTSNSVQNQVVFHEVLPKETLSIPLLKNTILALMN